MENNRIIIKPLELDIYIPSKQLAIEYCGIYWHTEDKKERNAHFNKYLACKNKDIQLITILNAKLGLLPKIAARDCEVKEITKQEAKDFINKYHLQGFAKSLIYLGLFYNGAMVGAITGGPHHRQGHKDVFILNRLCFGSHAVIGGANKLFKIFKQKVLNTGFKKIVSWSDNRWSNGRVYEAMGFSLEEELKIDYSYCKSKKRFSKQSCQKKMLLKKGAIGKTEKEMALSLGLLRIWDCGKKKWSLKI